MVDQPQYLTQEGLVNLEQRLSYLKDVRRQEIAERLQQALDEGGELTENAEYEDAKNEQAFVEGEIARLSQIIRNAQIIEEGGSSDQVRLGSRVTVVEKGTREKEVYHLVGPAEANPSQGKISFESPLGKALLDSKKGDKVVVHAPDGDITFVIRDIE